MDWEVKRGKPYAESCKGYSICWARNGDGWRYSAYAPNVYESRSEYEQELRERYEIGERIPQRHSLIGVFDLSDEAKAACEEHWRENNADAA